MLHDGYFKTKLTIYCTLRRVLEFGSFKQRMNVVSYFCRFGRGVKALNNTAIPFFHVSHVMPV